MSLTQEDTKALQAQFMKIWDDGGITCPHDAHVAERTISECEGFIKSVESDHEPTLKQARAIIADAEIRIDAICTPLNQTIKVAEKLLAEWDMKADADIEDVVVAETETEETGNG